MELAKTFSKIDPWGLMASKMAINQAEEIMGGEAAIKASSKFWCMNQTRSDRAEFNPQYNVDDAVKNIFSRQDAKNAKKKDNTY